MSVEDVERIKQVVDRIVREALSLPYRTPTAAEIKEAVEQVTGRRVKDVRIDGDTAVCTFEEPIQYIKMSFIVNEDLTKEG